MQTFDERPVDAQGDCPNCGAQEVDLFWVECCQKWMCEECLDKHDTRWEKANDLD